MEITCEMIVVGIFGLKTEEETEGWKKYSLMASLTYYFQEIKSGKVIGMNMQHA
jgi:hypothetical protein